MSLGCTHAKKKRRTSTKLMKPPQPYSEFSKGMECSSLVLVPYMREWPALWQMEKSNRGLGDVPCPCQCDEEIRGKSVTQTAGKSCLP